METMSRYSLNSSFKYSIDLPPSVYKYSNSNTESESVSKNDNYKNKKNDKNDKNDKFDKDCLDTYGKKCCIFYYIDNENIEVRLLDRLLNPAYTTTKPNLYTLIPDYLSKKYTVVVVEMIESIGKKDITAVHVSM